MRVALLSTCAVAVPPSGYGGTELVVAELAKQLVRRGHQVTTFATGDSRPAGELRWIFDEPVWPPCDLAELTHAAGAWRDITAADPPFDVVHAQTAPAIAFCRVCPAPVVLTLHHDRVEKLVRYYRQFDDVTYVAISHRQAQLVPEIAPAHVVHHGLDLSMYEAGDGSGGWLAFVGRFAPEKGPHVALDVARATGIPLHLGGRPHWVNEDFFARDVAPRLEAAGELAFWEGEVSFAPKMEMLRRARATLFPIHWEEPFGLVMIESMLVGTPVVAFARGAALEVVDEGVTGLVARDIDEMIDRVRRVGDIDRARCRQRAIARFDSARMAREYERVYQDAIRAHRRRHVSRIDRRDGPRAVNR